MFKVRGFCIAAVISIFLVNLVLGLWIFRPQRKTPRDETHELFGLFRNANETQPNSYLKAGGTQPTLYHRAPPTVTGAINHYKSLLDSQPVTLRCASCALVSSSGVLLGKGAGEEIDRHPCVIRMNMAPVDGYQNDVGNRTTLRVLNFFTGVKAETLPPASRVMVWGLFQHKPYLNKLTKLLKKLRAMGITIHGQTVEGERQAGTLFAEETGQSLTPTKTWLSTGWFAMMIALDMCVELHAYGMVPAGYCASEPKKDFPYHYYNNSSRGECKTYLASETAIYAHRFITEKAVFARWSLRYNITFHHPEWTLDGQNLTGKLDTPFINKLTKNKAKSRKVVNVRKRDQSK